MANSMDVTDIMERLHKIPALSVEDGINGLGDEDLFLEILTEYALTAKDQANKIEDFFLKKDIRNYTILVHSVKSTSRLIGAMGLSQMALDLEMAGNAEDISTIESDTPVFLELYRSLADAINFLTESENDENLPEISDSMLMEAVEVMKDGATAFDLMTVESVMDQLATYKLPESFVPIYKDLKKALADVEYDRITELLMSIH